MDTLETILILGLIVLDAIFLISYYQYNEENENENENEPVAQPIQMILIAIGLLALVFSDFHWISIIFLGITILVAFQINYTRLQMTKKAMVFTLWQTLCIASIILVILIIIVMSTNTKKKKTSRS